MRNSKLLRSFINNFNETIVKGDGVYLLTKKRRYLDSTSGLTGTSILGWGNKKIENAIKKQLKKICHIDYKYFNDQNREIFSNLILSKALHNLNKFFFVGGSGGEACEAAKMSYQYHYSIGLKEKMVYIKETTYHVQERCDIFG